jgi:hypothetical protein
MRATAMNRSRTWIRDTGFNQGLKPRRNGFIHIFISYFHFITKKSADTQVRPMKGHNISIHGYTTRGATTSNRVTTL